jgi:drug/metabolite transporter (DMT)-like permease
MLPMDPAGPGFERRQRLSAITLFIVGALALSAMDGVAKGLVQRDLPVPQIIALRGSLVVPLLLCWGFQTGRLGELRTSRPLHHGLRVLAGAGAPLLFFQCLKFLPLASATSIFYAAPFLMTALSVWLLREEVGRPVWLAIAVGFLGVAIALQPGTESFRAAAFLSLGACLAYSVMNLMGRWMARTESTFCLVFYFQLGLTLLTSSTLPWVWRPIDADGLLGVAAMSVLALAGSVSITRAFVLAPVSVIAPFEYTALIWSFAIGFVVFAEVPAVSVWIGALLILASGIGVARRELVRAPVPAIARGAVEGERVTSIRG